MSPVGVNEKTAEWLTGCYVILSETKEDKYSGMPFQLSLPSCHSERSEESL